MSYLDWKVGDRVVCIHDTWSGWGAHSMAVIPCPLRKGAIYTIRRFLIGVGYGVDGIVDSTVCVELEEAENPYGVAFDARRFRKVQPRKTSIEVFERILRDVTAKEDA